ncbi:G-type lectin S-receptor-like serine/threonine-protein kinase B120 [Abrus precatorius]|uniref:Receptor-like serine/threonine-protein kinase n=1 Tax=Abrus precatorius TaxID=3816 RepID=A0A8B8M0M2_ABRPR|nr:G-type lectin S-receptor-like serine/threonine-protein kinase B120 [Abrus precatorius]
MASMMITTYQRIAFVFFFSFLCFYNLFSRAASSRIRITRGDMIRDREGETLVSESVNFVMGFFSLDNSSSRYVGIWYYDIPGPAVIWVANRDNPIKDTAGSITVARDGNLVVLDGGMNQVWSSNVSIQNSNNSEAVLHDDGNLVLSSAKKEVWQSFENPSDTYVPGMKVPVGVPMGKSYVFTSWKSATDPSPGNYTMGVDPEGLPQIVVWEGQKRRWRSGYWDGRIFQGVYMTGGLLYGFTLNGDGRGGRYFIYNPLNGTDKVRFQVGWDGYEREFRWNEAEKHWSEIQKGPLNDCEVYNKCGSFGACDLSTSGSPVCSCIRGFEPKHRDEWDKGNSSGGCERITPLKAQRNATSGTEVSVGEDGFFDRRSMKLPDFARVISTDDCESDCLKNASCTAYANVLGIGCMVWYGELVDIQHFENGGNTLHIRLADSELGDGRRKNRIVIISAVVAGLICLGIFVWLVWRFKGKLQVLPTVSSASCCKNSDVLPVFDASKSRDMSAEFSGSADLSLEGNQLSGPEFPLFNFSCISIATDNFSEENKLGQGGFGPVYKVKMLPFIPIFHLKCNKIICSISQGKLPSGEQIAVKRLSRRSGQGLEEFKNEMMLIAKLQHRNLVRLMGCSIQGDEKLLVYEYMPNKSLDCFLFDPVKQTQLDWNRRIEIIEGIARGLLYLHRDSRLRIIHRDLKASNILLDENMNPKISDFGLARIFGGNQNEANTNRVVGTYGYMAPEYAMEGLFSVKSDVYSFGILLLEILSGRRNTSFRQSDDSSLIGYAWHLWNEHRAMELVDPCIRASSPKNKALRCIHIGMLCVQDSAAHRPTMSSVVLMLESEATALPLPTQPLITSMRRSEDREFYMDGLDVSNDLTVSMVVGR